MSRHNTANRPSASRKTVIKESDLRNIIKEEVEKEIGIGPKIKMIRDAARNGEITVS